MLVIYFRIDNAGFKYSAIFTTKPHVAVGIFTDSFEADNLPVGFEGGNTGTCPSQNLVDAFEMKSGVPFWDNPIHAANPYNNRDPRLDLTLLYNGVKWQGISVETFYGGRNGEPLNGASLTGYYIKKYLDPEVSLRPGNIIQKSHHYVIFRHAEILLNYAESMSQWKGLGYKDDTFNMSPLEAINAVRAMARMSKIPSNITEDEFKKRVRNERRVEFAFEDHRFWDIRRWKVGHQVTTIYGIKILKDESGQFSYKRVKIQDRVWNDKMYFYPISQSEILKNPNLTQNQGW